MRYKQDSTDEMILLTVGDLESFWGTSHEEWGLLGPVDVSQDEQVMLRRPLGSGEGWNLQRKDGESWYTALDEQLADHDTPMLRAVRKTLGWSGEKMGAELGYTQSQISMMEGGSREVRPSVALALRELMRWHGGQDEVREVTLKVDVSEEDAKALAALSEEGDASEVLARVARHISDGVCRPGSWERQLVERMFPADEWTGRLEQNPERSWRLRPTESRGIVCTVCGRELDREVARAPGDGDRCLDCDEEISL